MFTSSPLLSVLHKKLVRRMVVIACPVLFLMWLCIGVPVTHAGQRAAAKLQNGPVDRKPGPKYEPDKVLVRFRPGVSRSAMRAAHLRMGSRVLSEPAAVDRLQIVQLAPGTTVTDAVNSYRADPNVLYAEPDFLVQASGTPNDPQFPNQWNLQNTGQNGGTSGADIHATQAWDITTGSSAVVVGVIDTGVDYTHPDLAANIWTASSGFSVSGNGANVQCAAGVHGFNAVANTCDPLDDNGHGTHVSGIIGAAGNNSLGVAGVNWSVQILPCKFLDANGSGNIGGAVTCLSLFKSLKDSGANIVVSNNSWGGADLSQALQDAITAQMNDNILFVASAGNDFSDNDVFPVYPANVFLPNVISVAATTRKDDVVAFSNVGRHTVHIGAPGLDILSTFPNSDYQVLSGTSMAAPHVTGVAALLKAQDPTRDWRAIKNLILAGGDTLTALQETITQKRLNAFGALTCSNSTVQSQLLPAADTISASAGTSITLSFLNINCASPAGTVAVTVSPGGQTVTLTDDGANGDQAAGDGIYTGQFTPLALGNYSLQFPDGSVLSVEVLSSYSFASAPFSYRTITGTNLNLGDDSLAEVSSPFPIQYGGGSFNNLFVSSNGTVSFTDAFDGYLNFGLGFGVFPVGLFHPTTLVAPYWADLFPIKGTSQNVFWDVTGSAPNRELVVEWRNVRAFACRFASNETITFQVVFREGSSDVLFNYSNSAFGGPCIFPTVISGPSIGVQTAISVAVNVQSIPVSGSAILFHSVPAPAPSVAPSLNSISPSSAAANGPETTLTVSGSGFVPGSVVLWNSTALDTSFVSGSQLSAVLPAALLVPPSGASPSDSATITVYSPGPGGGPSNGLPFRIIAGSGSPTISSIVPAAATAGGFSFSLTVRGSNLTGAHLLWNGQELPSFVINDGEIHASISSNLIASPGAARITAVRSGASAGASNPVSFAISQAQPQTPSPLRQLRRASTDMSGSALPPAVSPLRFLGWNYGRRAGAAYLNHFSRPYGGVRPPAAANLTGATGSAAASVSNSAVSLTNPQTLPGFAFHPTLPAGYLPTSVATGDFNHDGKLDWVVSNGGSNDLWIYFGNGDGTAQLPVIVPLTGASPLQVVAADLRHTGVLDLVVAEADSQTIGVLLGNGDGTFSPEVTYFVPAPPLSVAVADVNGDGKLDIIAGLLGDEFTGPIATFLGDGSGNFGPPIRRDTDVLSGSFATIALVPVDLNGDGLADLLVVDAGGVLDGAHSYLSEGDGTFKQADYFFRSGIFSAVLSIAFADMDEDGCVDAVTTETLGLVRIFKGSCDGNFDELSSTPLITEGAGDVGVNVAVADMNGDGHMDVITSGAILGIEGFGQEAGNLITVLPGDGKGNLGIPRVYRGEPSLFGLAVADLNGDNHPDVIAASQDSDTALVFLNDGSGRFSGPSGEYIGYIDNGNEGTTNAPFTDSFTVDIDGDGKTDIAVIEQPEFFQLPWTLAVALNDGAGHFNPPIRSPIVSGNFVPIGSVMGDFRKTGRPDLLILGIDQATGTQAEAFVPNIGGGQYGTPVVTQLAPNFGTFGLLGAGDFNHDGKLDYVLAIQTTSSSPLFPASQQMAVFYGNGDGTFRQGPSLGFGSNERLGARPAMIFVGDFNKDGNLDVLVWTYDNIVGTLTHNVYEFLGNGDGTFQPAKLILPDFGFFGVADLNHDGLPDIVEYKQPPTALADLLPVALNIYLGQPDGSFKLTQTYQPYAGLFKSSFSFDNGSPQQTFSPMIADFNGDGNPDIAVFQSPTGTPEGTYFQILAGNGDGTFTPTYAINKLNKFAIPRTAADVTGDGRADLIEVDGWPSSFNVIPAVAGSALQLSLPVHPVIGANGTLTVGLMVANNADTTVQLSASDPNISIASSATIPAGQLSVNVPFTIAKAFNSSRVFSLTGQLGAQQATIYSFQTTAALAGFNMSSFFTTELAPPGGATASYNVVLVSFGGYFSAAQLSCQGLPAGATCQAGLNPLPVIPGQPASSSLTVQLNSAVPLGSYPFFVVASDGATTKQLPLVLRVADFNVSLAPPAVTVVQGNPAMFSLTVGSLGGWDAGVLLNCLILPANGIPCPFQQSSANPGTVQQTFTTSQAPPGDYTITISGTAGGVTHVAPGVVVHVQGVGGTLSSGSATIAVGSSATFNISLSSQNGFTNQFTFSCPGLPAGVSCSFNPPSGTLPPNGTLAGVLTVSVSSKPAAIAHLPNHNDRRPLQPWLLAIVMAVVLLLGITIAIDHTSAQRSYRRWAIPAFLCLALAAALIGCGGGGSGGGGIAQQPTPTPTPAPPKPTVVTVTVQANSSSLNVTMGVISVTVP